MIELLRLMMSNWLRQEFHDIEWRGRCAGQLRYLSQQWERFWVTLTRSTDNSEERKVHGGLPSADAHFHFCSQRRLDLLDGSTTYGGEFLASALLMLAAAHAGQIVVSQATVNRLDFHSLPAELVLLHMGRYTLPMDSASIASMRLTSNPLNVTSHKSVPACIPFPTLSASTTEASAQQPWHSSSHSTAGEKANTDICVEEAYNLYMVLDESLIPRLTLQPEPALYATQEQLVSLGLPVMSVVGI
jgi:hypothetical protein